MKITATVTTGTITIKDGKAEAATSVTITIKDGKAEAATSVTMLHSCDPLSDEKIAKAVRKIDPKTTVVSVTQRKDKYSIDIDEFVKFCARRAVIKP